VKTGGQDVLKNWIPAFAGMKLSDFCEKLSGLDFWQFGSLFEG
jgi:hypothetical protein